MSVEHYREEDLERAIVGLRAQRNGDGNYRRGVQHGWNWGLTARFINQGRPPQPMPSYAELRGLAKWVEEAGEYWADGVSADAVAKAMNENCNVQESWKAMVGATEPPTDKDYLRGFVHSLLDLFQRVNLSSGK